MDPDEATWDRIWLDIEEGRPVDWPEMPMHVPHQDTSHPAWHDLLQLIEDAELDGREIFNPRAVLGAEAWTHVVTLPESIATLKRVRTLHLYGSHLLSIPPEIGGMESLEKFVPYTSYGLHWFPYEITRCRRLKASTVSTRALYGNYKYRPPFPALEPARREFFTRNCSVCGVSLDGRSVQQAWISLPVGTDVLPLLVHACSPQCMAALPPAATGYVSGPHTGGRALRQPPIDE